MLNLYNHRVFPTFAPSNQLLNQKVMKKQFITRVFLSSLVLALTSLFGGGNLLAQKVVFYESFDECAGVGGNDGTWGGINQSATLTTTNAGWTFENENGANKCARFGTTKKLGSATTPVLNFEGAATLTFKAGAWKGDKTTLKISISNGSLSATTVTMADGAWTEYTINITNATTSTQIKFEGYQASKARFFLDEVKITQASSSDPGDTKTNPELAYGVREYNATIGQDNAFPALTHADGVTGIVYSSSEESVATVDKDGNVTLKGIEGSTTIKASISGSTTWKDDEASYTLNVSKPSANLAYSANSCTVIVGEAAELPTLTYAEGVDGIVYASSNTEVATVDATGKVTLTGAEGTTVISATFEGNATFANGSASYTLTVTKTNTYRYKKVTATEELMDGGQYIIVCEDLNLAKGPGSDYGSVEVNIDGKMIIPTESAALGVYTLEAKDGGYALKIVGDTKYLCSAGADKTGFLESETAEAWTVTFEKGNATIRCSDSPTRQILFSVTSSGASSVISCKNYASSNAGTSSYYYVQLYQKVYPLTVSSATGGYATFYNEEEAYQMPEGLTGYAVTKAEAGDCITRKTAYEAGATVPAKTPLLIIGTTDGGNYYPAVVSGTGVEAYAGSNLLEGARDAEGYTSSSNGNVYYYKLGLNTKGVPGFYWGAANGAAFKMTKATTAYLAVPKTVANGANALFFDFGPETGINEIQTEQADKAIFDLSGRRVQKATKGFYIVGGKKVLVK